MWSFWSRQSRPILSFNIVFRFNPLMHISPYFEDFSMICQFDVFKKKLILVTLLVIPFLFFFILSKVIFSTSACDIL
jgi:hypothetical protein